VQPGAEEAPRLAIVAYGKLGSRDLSYGSDLDIIFLHDDADQGHAEHYLRLAQRVTHWLSALTPAGILYETDLRLRPHGEKGLMVSSLDGFRDYQARQA